MPEQIRTPTWEYRMEYTTAGLLQLGKEGWEAVGLSYTATATDRILMKRQIGWRFIQLP